MTHDRCSELLRGYARGELPDDVSDEVRAHLATGGDCRAEERAVAALAVTDGVDARPLDDVERARLQRGLAQELFTARANADVAGAAAPERRWARWIAPAATAAAVLAGVLVMTLGGGADDAAETALQPFSRAGEGGADAGGADDSAAQSQAGGQVEDKRGRRRGLTAATGQASTESDFAGPEQPAPVFDPDGGTITTSELSEIGRGRLFRSFADSYRPEDGPGLYDRFLEQLTTDAVALGPQIEACAATLPQDGSLIPTYATVGEYDGRRALVVGFVTGDPGSRTLDRYLMWVWEIDVCEQPIDTLFERIDSG
ncbi:MAG TPA: hypothetical protein VEV43_03055 [Actinomycetota bacterium]|nr:hypothetical protein [Actinomycetota bacterium]